MPLVDRRLDIRPEPLDIARRIAHRPGAVLLYEASRAVVACDPIETAEELDPEPSLVLDGHAPAAAAAPRWIGMVPYEALRTAERASRVQDFRPRPSVMRPRWQRYGATAIVTPAGVCVVGDDAECVRDLCARLERPAAAQAFSLRLSEPLEAGSAHRRRIRRALELIAAGELYQVNLARCFVADVRGGAVDLLAALQPGGAAPHAAALTLGDSSVISLSPELLLSLDARGSLRTAPIKGTRPRGINPASDKALARELDRDPKERAELTMVIDVERNDLGRIAVAGSVRVHEPPHVRSLSSVHHRVAVLGAELRPGVDRSELFLAMLPSGSVTGAPKVRAMEVIAELEPERRGLYTGGFGSIGHDGSLMLGMAIRTLVVRDGRGVWFSGGGIVADSRPELEVEETLWKARPFLALAGIPLPADTNSVPEPFAVR